MSDRRYSEPRCQCGDTFCAGCDDPQIDTDLDDVYDGPDLDCYLLGQPDYDQTHTVFGRRKADG